MARSTFLQFQPPCITEGEIEAAVSVLRTGWLSSGPKCKELEAEFQKFVSAPGALTLNSCTAGLHLAMLAHDIGPGDEVITTPITFCASANVVEHVGGTVVLVDVDTETLLIDPKKIEEAITPKTKMILPVHYAGHPCDMNAINAIAEQHELAVVEDAAHCITSKIGEKMVGDTQNLCTFSFYATKNMTTGEGGMITGPSELLDTCRRLALHGMDKNAWNRYAKGGTWRYDVPEPGFKYNMPDIAAAIGLEQLRRTKEMYNKRLELVKIYDDAFKTSPYVKTLQVRKGYQSSHHLYVLFLQTDKLKITRDEFITQMTELNIGTSLHFIPIHTLSYYKNKYGWKANDFPNANRAYESMVSIPLSAAHSVQDARDVVDAVQQILKTAAK
jgi:dTDP-4-amino-4,6-dideoxygalactose transaminase